MIHKLVKITGIGRYRTISAPFSGWNGVFKRTTLIYGENGTGKSTFSAILQSLTERNNLLTKKKSFNYHEAQNVIFLDSSNKQLAYRDGQWNKYIDDIFVFDTAFINQSISTFDTPNYDRGKKLFEIFIGPEGISLKERASKLKASNWGLRKRKNKLENRARLAKKKEDPDYAIYERKYSQVSEKLERQRGEERDINNRLSEISKEAIDKYFENLKRYIGELCPHITLKTIKSKRGKYLRLILEVEENEVYFTNNPTKYNAHYVLSESDKNSLALALFLAHVSKDIHQSTLVLDDPVTSFDYNRRNVTVNLLKRLSDEAKQTFILTHDLQFSNLVADRFGSELCLVKIEFTGVTSTFTAFNPRNETMPGLFKDLLVIKSYLKNGAISDGDRRDVARCIRPVLEGYLRIKYFSIFDDHLWLGDMIKRIQEAQPSTPLEKAKSIITDLEDLNNYSKEWHHSNPGQAESQINSNELRSFVEKLISLIYKL